MRNIQSNFRHLFIFLGITIGSTVEANAQATNLSDNFVVLVTTYKDTLSGVMEVDVLKELLFLRSKDKVRVVSFKSISALKVMDHHSGKYHSFHRYHDVDKGVRGQLLEQLAIGEVHFLRKMIPFTPSSQMLEEQGGATILRKPVAEYYLFSEGALIKVRNFRKQLKQLVNSEQEQQQLDEFAAINALDHTNPSHQLSLIIQLNKMRSASLIAGN